MSIQPSSGTGTGGGIGGEGGDASHDGTAAPGSGSVANAPPGLGAPETRGRTEIADRVLERIAARAVAENTQAGGSARRLLGVPLARESAHTAARVTAHADGHLATVSVSLSVTYPTPIRQVTRGLREAISVRVGELTGLDVRQVDIDISALIDPVHRTRRVQ